jgi:LDH2 family malate/lactate/ureidoglycolate dehydrogenase
MGFWAQKAVSAGLLGLALTNTSPLVAPTGARAPLFGTNPICFAADKFMIDCATSTVAVGKVEVAHRKGLDEAPPSWGIDGDGITAKRPIDILDGGALSPVGYACACARR